MIKEFLFKHKFTMGWIAWAGVGVYVSMVSMEAIFKYSIGTFFILVLTFFMIILRRVYNENK